MSLEKTRIDKDDFKSISEILNEENFQEYKNTSKKNSNSFTEIDEHQISDEDKGYQILNSMIGEKSIFEILQEDTKMDHTVNETKKLEEYLANLDSYTKSGK